VAVARWLATEFPAIGARAKREGGVVLWLDAMGVRSDAAAGDHRLGVVALHGAGAGPQEAAVRVGDVGGGLRVGRLVAGPRLDVRAGQLALRTGAAASSPTRVP
jgi:hypothetical protein